MLRSAALKPTISRSSPGEIVYDPPRRGAHAAALAALVLLRGYKLLLSPFFAGSCRFEPSCSDYMAESIRLHGLRPGLVLGIKRLSRCRPLGGHGFDPVPRP